MIIIIIIAVVVAQSLGILAVDAANKKPSEVKRSKLDVGNLMCFSCASLDDKPYTSQYHKSVKQLPQDVCNDPFPDLSATVPKEQSSNYLMFERLVPCNADAAGSVKAGGKARLAFHCVKMIGIDKNSGSNITTRGCFKSVNGYFPERDHIDSGDMIFGSYHIRGTAYFCQTDACNHGNAVTHSVRHSYFTFFILTYINSLSVLFSMT